MKAAWFESFGDADKVIQIGVQPKPVVGEGQVLIKLATSGVNPSDVKKRAGAFSNLLDDGLIIPHSDGAGIITKKLPKLFGSTNLPYTVTTYIVKGTEGSCKSQFSTS